MAVLDRLSRMCALAAAWFFVATGAMITYEVTARYVFNAPTIWAAELSQLLMIWATFLAAAWLYRTDAHISINLLTTRLGPAGRRAAEAVTALAVCAVAFWLAYHGAAIFADSWATARSTGTMMDLPNWLTEASAPFGCALLGVQALARFVSRAAGGAAAGTTAQPLGR